MSQAIYPAKFNKQIYIKRIIIEKIKYIKTFEL